MFDLNLHFIFKSQIKRSRFVHVDKLLLSLPPALCILIVTKTYYYSIHFLYKDLKIFCTIQTKTCNKRQHHKCNVTKANSRVIINHKASNENLCLEEDVTLEYVLHTSLTLPTNYIHPRILVFITTRNADLCLESFFFYHIFSKYILLHNVCLVPTKCNVFAPWNINDFLNVCLSSSVFGPMKEVSCKTLLNHHRTTCHQNHWCIFLDSIRKDNFPITLKPFV